MFGFDVHDTRKTKIYIEKQLSSKEMDFMYENQGEVTYGATKGMRLFYKCLNFLFHLTLAPKSGNATTVQGITRNLLGRMSNESEHFSMVDFL